MRTKINRQAKVILTVVALLALCVPTHAMAEKKVKAKATPTAAAPAAPSAATPKIDAKTSGDSYVTSSSTHIDFTDTAIDGKMKSPDGFMLQGHKGSSLSQMVKLRSNFRNELNNSKSATKAIVK